MQSMQVPSLNEGSCEIEFIKIYSQKTAAAWITDKIRANFHFSLKDPSSHGMCLLQSWTATEVGAETWVAQFFKINYKVGKR